MKSFGPGVLAPLARFSLSYAEMLLKDVRSTDFAKKPKGVDTNHGAFIYGHLALYPERLFDLVGQGALAKPDQKFMDLFAAGKPCLDDPLGTTYPAMEIIVARFRTRYEAVIPVLAETPDEVYHRPNPNERMKDRFPTIAIACNFLVSGHILVHLGQMSAWRRCMDLGPVM
jgi:hypothetical protein